MIELRHCILKGLRTVLCQITKPQLECRSMYLMLIIVTREQGGTNTGQN
jgi:hypothetical protein